MPYLERKWELNNRVRLLQGDNSYPAHFHKNIEFLYSLSDDVEVMIDNQKLTLNVADFLIIESFAVHHIIGKEETISLCVSEEYLKDFFAVADNKRFTSSIIHDNGGEILNRLYEFSDIKNKNVLIKKSMVDGFLGFLIDINPLVVKPEKTNEMIEKIVVYLNENYKNQLSLKTIADGIGYSRFTISHGFKKSVGMEIREYLNQIRINALVGEIEKNRNKRGKKFIEYAYEVGFDSVQTFYRAFKKSTGVSPKTYFNQDWPRK